MFKTVLIANRGAIATRIIRTLKQMGIRSVAVYAEADADSLHVQQADEAICLGDGPANQTYLDIDKILAAAKQTGAEAIHPGYGFLSENTDFVQRCEDAGIIFIGPTPEQITLFGLKHQARDAAVKADVPLLPGSSLLNDLDSAKQTAADIGYPVMLKSTAGGGGIGMQICADQQALENAWESVRRLSQNYFSNNGVFIEKYIARARHIEVQIFGDGQGNAISLGERDCSAQRRHQKVIEETPAPNLSDEQRLTLHQTAERLMQSVNYRNAGTVEFLFDADSGQFYFLEVNTRLQVEHGVTEQVWGVDLVQWMVQLAEGELGSLSDIKSNLRPGGHSIQVRVYAEDPNKDFQPAAGLLTEVDFPQDKNIRIDHWIEAGLEVPAYFDPMLAKIIVTADNREHALQRLSDTLANTKLYGIETNLDYLKQLIAWPITQQAQLTTRVLNEFVYQPNSIDVLAPGTQTTLQDYPGRTGLWHIGVPPSGPMDNVAFRLANQLVENNKEAAALEITLNGPTLKFNCDQLIALTGSDIEATLDDQPCPMWQTVEVKQGQTLSIGKITGDGARAYLAVKGGFQCPDYLGSKSTFTLGQFGGHGGRALRSGDVLHLVPITSEQKLQQVEAVPQRVDKKHRPAYQQHWQIRVMYGPHGAPEFFTEHDVQTIFDTAWEVHYNSSRTGVRLIGPKPEWARADGGEAGLHPSNIHDNAYAFGTLDFTGDMPVLLGPDGPSLGGFVCPATVIQADLWKLGQLKAGATVQFVPVTIELAVKLENDQLEQINQLSYLEQPVHSPKELPSPIAAISNENEPEQRLVYRTAGDHFLLVEFGELTLDIERRFKVHALMLWLEKYPLAGIQELTPGIRSLQIHYNSQQLSLAALLEHLKTAEQMLQNAKNLSVPSRIVHIPLSWDDPACKLAIEKYMQSVRKDAPWCPSNLEFIRRMNGLDSIQQVKDIVFNASYLVMGLGDVYLGAPVATPLDPRHRLVTTKYNPARTWTAENSVGIGGAYLCVYGMEGPGGYQFVGRTLQMWNRYRQTKEFDQPWLLRFFDQIRFYEVSADELQTIRRDFPKGQYPIRIEQTEFNLAEYQAFLDSNQESIDDFIDHRQQAFELELAQWKANGQFHFDSEQAEKNTEATDAVPEHWLSLDSSVSGSVWQCLVEEGQSVKVGDTVLILESMKMEIEIQALQTGVVQRIAKQPGQPVQAGQTLMWIQGNE